MSVSLAGVLAGCQAPLGAPVAAELSGPAGNEAEAQLEFWHALNDVPVASNDQAFHALLLYLDAEDPAADYPGRVDLLKQRGLLPPKFDRPADEAVGRGTLAVAIARSLDLRGGWAMRTTSLLGLDGAPAQRYAVRELIYRGLLPPSSPQQTFSGAELVGVIGRVEDWERTNRRGGPAMAAQE